MDKDKTRQINISTPGEHIRYFDVLRTLSMSGVLFMHLSSARLAEPGCTGWGLLVLLDSFFFIAVPLFFMISGALILQSGPASEPAHLLRHRLPRLLIPLVFWSAAVLALPFLRELIHGNGFDLRGYLYALTTIAAHEAAPPYWFLYYLIPLYLLSPALKAAANGLTEKSWRYLGILALIVCTYKTCVTLLPFAKAFQIEIFERLFLFSGCAAYFFFGFYLHQMQYRVPNGILLGIILGDTVLISVGTWIRSAGGVLDQSFQSYNLLFTLVLAISVFLLAKQNNGRLNTRTGKVFNWLAARSFGVYLSHVPVILLLPSAGIDLSSGKGFIYSLFLVPAVCLLISWGISRVRFLCWPLTGARWQKKAQPNAGTEKREG